EPPNLPPPPPPPARPRPPPPLRRHRRRNLIGIPRGGRPLARTVGKDVDLRETHLAQHPARRREVLLPLAGKADDNIRGERRPVQRLPQPAAALPEAGHAAAAP